MPILRSWTGLGLCTATASPSTFEHVSADVLAVEEGSLYPALQRMLIKGWVKSEWGVSENNRRARYYRLTPAGRRPLAEEISDFRLVMQAITRVIEPAEPAADVRSDMDAPGEFCRRLLFLLRGNHFNREMEEEMRFHLEKRTAANCDIGADSDEARNGAMHRFGNAALMRERSRDAWGWAWLDHFRQDLKFALRSLARTPSFAAVVILTLAFGIGVNAAIFSAVYALILNPYPFPACRPARLSGGAQRQRQQLGRRLSGLSRLERPELGV